MHIQFTLVKYQRQVLYEVRSRFTFFSNRYTSKDKLILIVKFLAISKTITNKLIMKLNIFFRY